MLIIFKLLCLSYSGERRALWLYNPPEHAHQVSKSSPAQYISVWVPGICIVWVQQSFKMLCACVRACGDRIKVQFPVQCSQWPEELCSGVDVAENGAKCNTSVHTYLSNSIDIKRVLKKLIGTYSECKCAVLLPPCCFPGPTCRIWKMWQTTFTMKITVAENLLRSPTTVWTTIRTRDN